MGDTGATRDRKIQLLTLAARALSSGVAAFWVYAAIGYAITNRTPWSLQAIGLAMLIVGTAASAVFAYFSAGLGGALMILAGITHGITTYWTAESGRINAATVSGGPFILAGLLFLSAWSRSRKKTLQTKAAEALPLPEGLPETSVPVQAPPPSDSNEGEFHEDA